MVNFVVTKQQSARRPVKTTPKCSTMKDSKEMLKQEMRTHFAVDARRIDLLSRLLIALLQVCTVSYAQLALALNAKVKISSNVKRLQRFFKEFSRFGDPIFSPCLRTVCLAAVCQPDNRTSHRSYGLEIR